MLTGCCAARCVPSTVRMPATPFVYGGSVKPDNVRLLTAQPEIDGVLVGSASLNPVSFASIVNF